MIMWSSRKVVLDSHSRRKPLCYAHLDLSESVQPLKPGFHMIAAIAKKLYLGDRGDRSDQMETTLQRS